MLVNGYVQYQPQMVAVMSDVDILAATVKSSLREIAKQASALGVGLQNAAPGDKSETPNNSVQYLLSIAEELVKSSEDFDSLRASDDFNSLRVGPEK